MLSFESKMIITTCPLHFREIDKLSPEELVEELGKLTHIDDEAKTVMTVVEIEYISDILAQFHFWE